MNFKNIFLFFIAAFFSLSFSCQGEIITEKPMVIIIPSYNNIEWFKVNLDSIFTQEYTNYRCIYINDQSNDGTEEAIKNYLNDKEKIYHEVFFDDQFTDNLIKKNKELIKRLKELSAPFILVNNINRCGALANLYRTIHSCQDNEIIVTVDGDDWLYDNQVLKKLNEAYSTQSIWLTHGRLIEYPSGSTAWCEPVPGKIIQNNEFRKFKCPSHLRTFYAGLFKKIKLNDLIHEKKFFMMTWDMAIMYPMIEMAGYHHAFISEVNYVYNMFNQINDNKVNPQLQRDLDHLIRKKTPYSPLEKDGFKNN